MVATALERLAVIPRWRITSVVFAAILIAAPLRSHAQHPFEGLSNLQLELLSLTGLAVGWILLDRLAARRVRPTGMLVIVIALAAGVWLVPRVAGLPGLAHGVGTTVAVSLVLGGLVRGTTDARRSMTSLVVIAAVSSWMTVDLTSLPVQPLRDVHLYLEAGARALTSGSPYTMAPLTSSVPMDHLPFVYPPFTIPLFEILAAIPEPLALALWEAASVLAVVAAFWLLGVRGRWLVVLLAWPAPAVGIAVGNVASFTFLLYALGFRFGVPLVLSGIFKFQSAIPSLWLVRERRWREIATGIGVIAVLCLLSVPIVGVQTWFDWPGALRSFQGTLQDLPSAYGQAFQRSLGPVVALGVTVIAIGFAFLARGRAGLARFGFASVVGSPTLYPHGLSPLLAGVLFLGPECLWLFLGLDQWTHGLGISGAWLAIAFAGTALLVVRGDDLRLPGDLEPSRADVHPAAGSGQVWPEAS